MELKYLVDPETFDKTLDEETREIAKLIDTLRDMALIDRRNGVPTVAEFDHRLQELYPKKNELGEEIRRLKNILSNPEEFFYDRERELGDEQELLRITKDIEELESQRTRYENEKKPYLRDQELHEKNIEKNQTEVDRLSDANKEAFKDNIDTLNGIIAKDEQELDETLNALRKYDSLIAEINRKLLPLNKKKEDLEKKLADKVGYTDYVKKEDYEKKYNSALEELTKVNVEIGSISNHPVYLAATARFPLKSSGIEPLKNIIKQLADIARKGPHMDTPTSDIAALDEIKDRLVKERERAYREKQNSSGLVKPLETRINSFSYAEEDLSSNLKTWLESTKDKQDKLTAEIKKVLEDKNRLAEEIAYRKKLHPEDVKPEVLKETDALEEVKSSYDRTYDAYLNELTLYQKLTDAINGVLNNEIANLEESYNTSLNEDLQTTLDSLKEHKINFLGTKSRIDQEVEKLMMEVVGIEHRKKFNSSPSEVEAMINERLDALQAKFDEQMHTFFAPKAEEEEPVEEVAEEPAKKVTEEVAETPVVSKEEDLESTAPVEEVPVIDLQAAMAPDPMEEPAVDDEPGYVPEERTTYVHEPVGEYFGEVEPADDELVKTSEIPAFNPTATTPEEQKEEAKQDLENGGILKVTDVQELGVNASEEKDRQADFTTIIPQDGPDPDEGIDFSEIDDILSGVGRGR